MDQDTAIEAFAALAQSSRMSIFRLLIRQGPDGMQVGEIAKNLGIKASTLSGHLAVLRRSGLLKSTRNQREIYYAASLSVVNDLVRFLISDCCNGQVANCSEILTLLQDR